jgi:hypothetical protein
MNNIESNTFKCNTCKHTTCINCFCKISKDYHCDITNKSILSFKCPFCRKEDNYGFSNFNNDEVIFLATEHLRVIKKVLKSRDDEIIELRNQLIECNIFCSSINQNDNREIIRLKDELFTFKTKVENIKTKTITTIKLQKLILS